MGSTDSTTQSPPSTSASDQLLYLQSLGAITGRGEFASEAQKASARRIIEQLVEGQDTVPKDNAEKMIQGKWELVFSDTELFRSSPFFMAGRAVCQTPQQADQYNWFCKMHRKALAISQIQCVRQIISETQLVSEFEVSAGAVPFLNDFTPFSYSGGWPLTIEGAIVSTADYAILNNNSTGAVDLSLYMDTVEIKGSNLPFLRRILDDSNVKLDSRRLSSFLENQSFVFNYEAPPRPVFRTVYLSDQFRVSRDEDDHLFVYVKTSSDTKLTDYSSVQSDLGVLSLLEGFNDAITRFYL